MDNRDDHVEIPRDESATATAAHAAECNRTAIIEIFEIHAANRDQLPSSSRVSFAVGAANARGRCVFACDPSREEDRSIEFGDRASPEGGEGCDATTGRDGAG